MNFMKCACIETLYTELPFPDRFRAAKEDGFGAVEFWSWTDKDLEAVKASAEAAGVVISGFNGDADFSLIDPAQKADYLAFLRQSVHAAKKIGARSVTIHSNALGEGGVVVNHYDDLSHTVKLCAMFDTLHNCADIAEESGIRMNLEALNITTDHVGNFLTTTQMAAGCHEPGTGEINCRAVYNCLAEAGYRGFIGYELFPKTTTAEAVKAIMAD